MNKISFLFLTGFIVSASLGLVPRLGWADDARLQTLVEQALESNPALRARYDNWQAARYKITQARALPDPTFSVSVPGANVETRVGPQERKYRFSQKIPIYGKRDLRGNVQKQQAGAARQQYEAARRELIKNVKSLYYDLFWVDKTIATTQEEKLILENLEQATRRKYASGIGPQQDVLKAQLELTKLEERLLMLGQRRKSLAARLNSILNRSPETPIEPVVAIDPVPVTMTLEQVVDAAQENRQELKAAGLNVEKARLEQALARRDFLPDFTFGVEYIEIGAGTTTHPDDGRDAWMGMVSVNLPIWFNRLGAQLQEKKAGLEAALQNLADLENTVAYEAQDVYFKVDTLRDTVRLYETALIPQAQQTFDSAKVAYESGQLEFMNWLDAERKLLNIKTSYYRILADYNKAVAMLERIIGKDVTTDRSEGDSHEKI